MNILSIGSWVAYGHVGNAAAVFPMQRLGHEVWAVNTLQFSNHPGYGAFRGQFFQADAVRDIVNGIADRGLLPSCDAVLSGYLGDAAIGDVVLDAVISVKSANPNVLYCCDPVIGDAGPGVYVRQDFGARDRCRRAVEQLARGSKLPEVAVAHRAVAYAARARDDFQR